MVIYALLIVGIGNQFIQEVVFFKVEKKEGITLKEIGFIYPLYEK
jgi:hypothetical protein